MRLTLVALLACVTAFAAAAQQKFHPVVVGNVRIEILSPTLVRIEQKGPEGFEDRPTFNVVGRTGWPEAPWRQNVMAVDWANWELGIPNGGDSLDGLKIYDKKGNVVYTFDGKLTNSEWLPEPGHVPRAWAFADTPRMVPSKFGLTPDLDDPSDLNSGWDLGNDAPDVYVFLPNGSYKQLRSDFLKLTGRIEMPPLYALGFTDSRYYEYHQDEALQRMDEYRRRQFPLDTFVVDTDWRVGGSHGYQVNTDDFPDMPAFLQDAHKKHVHIMFNDHPEPQSKTALDPKELQYRLNGLGGLLKEGVDIWWYDRNWGVSLIDPMPGLRHEVWGMKLYHDMTQRVFPDRRPLIMANVDGIDNGFRSRPPEVVTHRYPVQWTGDTRSQWAFLRRGVENAVFEGVEGLNAWVNEDLGGHVGKPDPELYIRYLQYGSVCPFMRVHCTKGQTREPWAFGPEAERIVPDYIKMRYRLMPLFYASARDAYDTGEPIVRRCDLDYPQFKEAAADDQFLLGDSLLVAPIVGGRDAAIVPPSAFSGGLQAAFFDGRNLQGDALLTRQDKALDFNWGEGSPDPKVPDDNFSARWTGRITVPKDHPYRLALTTDDGGRLWIDGKQVIDKWVAQDDVTNEAPVNLAPGSTHDIEVEYMEMTGNAICQLRWRPVTGNADASQRSVWIPPGTWISVWNGQRIKGPRTLTLHASLSQMPMYLREGAILPLGPDVQWTGQKDWSSLGLEVVPGHGSFSLYEDDGKSPDYEKGAYRTTAIQTSEIGGRIDIDIAGTKGSYPGGPAKRSWTVRVLAPNAREVKVDGKRVAFKRVAAAQEQPFRNSGGEPTGGLIEFRIPAAPVAKAHRCVVQAAKGSPIYDDPPIDFVG